jgi:hypothetical protein
MHAYIHIDIPPGAKHNPDHVDVIRILLDLGDAQLPVSSGIMWFGSLPVSINFEPLHLQVCGAPILDCTFYWELNSARLDDVNVSVSDLLQALETEERVQVVDVICAQAE